MPTTAPTLPPAPHPLSPRGGELDPLTIDTLAQALRGMPRDTAFWVDTADGLRPACGVAPAHTRQGAKGLVLLTTEASAVQPTCSVIEDRYRAALQAIARGRADSGAPIRSVEAQDVARKVLIEMGDDWTRQGTAAG